MGDRPESFPRSARVRTNVRRKYYGWFVGLVYYPRELSGVTTARPRVPGVLQYTQGGVLDTYTVAQDLNALMC
jgi:hypothetical protein